MSINGVSGLATTPLIRPQEQSRPRVAEENAGATAAQAPVQTARTPGAALLAPRQEALPAEAPDGTDPELWQVLTTEERAFFARMNAMGPLTYGRVTPAPAASHNAGEGPLPRGGRIDVRA